MKFDQKAFLTFIKESFCFLKSVNHLDDLVTKSIPLEKGTNGYLMPISSLHLKNPQFLKNITDSEKQSNSLMVNSNDEKLSQSILNTDDDQIFLMLVDQFQNEIGCIQITVEQTLACSLKVNKAVLFNQNSKNLFIVV